MSTHTSSIRSYASLLLAVATAFATAGCGDNTSTEVSGVLAADNELQFDGGSEPAPDPDGPPPSADGGGGHPVDDGGVPEDDGGVPEDDGGGDHASLPYNFDMELGGTYRPITEAFAARGHHRVELVSVEMPAPEWRLSEIRTGAPITVTAEDCAHAGNHGAGRDRVWVTFRNADGSTRTEHMTLRYCAE